MLKNTNDSARSLSQPRRKSLNDWAHELAAALFAPVARWLQRMNVSPNAVTVFGFFLSLAAGIVLAWGHLEIGAALVALSGLLDGLDGLLARLSQKSSRFGAFLDSVLDRWSDSVVLMGLLVWSLRMGMSTQVVLACAALASSLLVSYTRARAEGVGAQCKEGWFTRLERTVTLVAGLVLKQVGIALWILAVFSTFTALQRIYYTWKYIKIHFEE